MCGLRTCLTDRSQEILDASGFGGVLAVDVEPRDVAGVLACLDGDLLIPVEHAVMRVLDDHRDGLAGMTHTELEELIVDHDPAGNGGGGNGVDAGLAAWIVGS